MPFQPGESGNPEGRPKGSENKIRAQLREKITEFLLNNFDKVIEEVNQLPVEQKLKFYFMLLPYGLSKKKEDPAPPPEPSKEPEEKDIWAEMDERIKADFDKALSRFASYKPQPGNNKAAEEINKAETNTNTPPQEKGG